MKLHISHLLTTLIVFCAMGPLATNGEGGNSEPPPRVLRETDRIVFVGDSITGLGERNDDGFVRMMRTALKQIHGTEPAMITLGSSGQGVGSWMNIEKDSREQLFTLDVPGVDVKATLDGGADVVVIMLGMNDILNPNIDSDEEGLDTWIASYGTLIDILRQRTKARVIALASVTMATEDPESPKNVFMEQMNRRLAALAREKNCVYLPTAEEDWKVLRKGRQIKPDFHVTYDFVHPTAAGHLGIAIGMLKGLGETAAADWLTRESLATLFKKTMGDQRSISCEIVPVRGALDTTPAFKIRYTCVDPNPSAVPPNSPVTLTAPPGWKVTPPTITGGTGEFLVTGPADRLENILIVTSPFLGEQETKVTLPPGWRVGTAFVSWWKRADFDPKAARVLAIDEAIEQGKDFTAPIEIAGKRLTWSRYFPTVNYAGLASPGSVDFFGVICQKAWEGGYAARWIHSDRERPVKLAVSTQCFTADIYVTVWLNGKREYAGLQERGRNEKPTVETQLAKGWNVLVFKSLHGAWLWQNSVELLPTGTDDFSDLRFSTAPPGE